MDDELRRARIRAYAKRVAAGAADRPVPDAAWAAMRDAATRMVTIHVDGEAA